MDAEALAADRWWWGIYQEAFDAAEREPPDVILESVRRGVGVAVRATLGGQTVGFATLHLLSEPAAVFLVYLAVDAARRAAGIGGALFECAVREGEARQLAQGRESLGTIWEVSAASDFERLLRFYRRHGGVLLDAPYVQPALQEGGPPVPMRLMFRPGAGAPPPDDATVTRLVRAMYREKYGALNGLPARLLDGLLRAQGYHVPSATR